MYSTKQIRLSIDVYVCVCMCGGGSLEQQISSIPVFSWVHLLREEEVHVKMMLWQR